MARINFEPKIFQDKRFTKLAIKLGDRRAAIGALVEAWMVAQVHYLNEKNGRLIPVEDWEKQELCDELVDVGFAKKLSAGYRMAGADDQFAWLVQKKNAGLKSAEARKKKKAKKKQKVEQEIGSQVPLSPVERVLEKTEHPSTSLLSTPYSSLSSQDSITPDSLQGKNPSNKSSRGSTSKSGDSMHRLALLWNEHCGKLPKVKAVNATRLKKIKALWSEQNEEQWVQTIQRLAKSDFCTGKNQRSWVATFDFLLQPESWIKVNEGKYDNRKTGVTTRKSQVYDNLDRLEDRWKNGPEVSQ